MFIRKYWRQLCLTIASVFWASCGTENENIVGIQPAGQDPLPENPVLGDVPESSQSVLSEDPQSSSSLDDVLGAVSSSVPENPRDPSKITLYSDPTVTCEETESSRAISYHAAPQAPGTCEEYKVLVAKDSAYTAEQLQELQDGLENCDESLCQEVMYCLYGIISPVIPSYSIVTDVRYECSNGETYTKTVNMGMASYSFPRVVDNILYLSSEEYLAGTSASPKPAYAPAVEAGEQIETSLNEESSSSAGVESESSSSTEMASVAKRMNFVKVSDVVNDAAKSLYAKYVAEIAADTTTEERKRFLESYMDEFNESINMETFSTEYADYETEEGAANCELRGWLKEPVWFNGFIAKYQELPDGTVEQTERYKEKLEAIQKAIEERIESEYKS